VSEQQLVVGAVIVDSLDAPTRVMAAKRSPGGSGSGLWEFPGGKVEPGEKPEAALKRELREELDVDCKVGRRLGGDRRIDASCVLRLYLVTVAAPPKPQLDHDEIRWLSRDDLGSVEWLAADRRGLPAVEALVRSATKA
jgi:8-oxo-dGTP diphosphatase